VLGKVFRLFARYPEEACVRPRLIDQKSAYPEQGPLNVLAFQSVPDKFYFLLFGAIRDRLSARMRLRAELVVVRAISGAMGSGLVAGLKRSAPLAWLLSRQWERAYGAQVDAVAYRCATWAHPFADLLDWFKAGACWRQLQQQESFSLKLDGIEVADLVVDSYLRFKPSPEFNVKDPFVRRLVWQALRDVRQARAYFGRVRPRWYLTSYTTYLEHGIPVRAALHQGVDVWSFGNLSYFIKRLSVADPYHTPNYTDYWRAFQLLDQQDKRLQAARLQLESRLAGVIDDATSYMRQSAYAQNDTELPCGLDGAVVIFLHDFYDSPHVYPDLIFDDFWQWVCTTVGVLQKAGIPFFLKPHPNQVALSDQALVRLRKEYPDLNWLPAAASNIQLVQAGSACGITAYGTVAHELAYLGVPTIGCARHPHHAFDFCRTARTRSEYEGMLLTHTKLPVPVEEMERQALAFYYIHNIHGDDALRVLRQALLSFWKTCNQDDATAEQVTHQLLLVTRLPAFDRLIEEMTSNKDVKMLKLDAAMVGKCSDFPACGGAS